MANQANDRYHDCLLSAYYNALSDAVGVRYADGLIQMLSGEALTTLDKSPLNNADRDRAYNEVRKTVQYAVSKATDTGKSVSDTLGPVYWHLRGAYYE